VVKLVREKLLGEYNIHRIGDISVIVLALDTSTRGGSVAVVRDYTILLERRGDGSRTHGERLPEELMRILEDVRLAPGSIDLLAVAAGPGSFTGLRVGIAAVQGLAMALGRRVAPVSTLEALARAGAAIGAAERNAMVAPWLDAQRGEVFASLYDAEGRRRLSEPTSLPPMATLDGLPATEAHIRFIGDGALRYADRIEQRLGSRASVVRDVPALAGIIGQVASEGPERAVAPHALAPIYVRRPDAELARDRRRMKDGEV
jgi:tRNA threonylcarbamoyladenosine biosynthesis protein TsaB